MPSQSFVWFITASSSGFGHAIALEALSRGHKVIATARNSSKLSDLKAAGAHTMDLDVTSNLDSLKRSVAEAHSVYGRIDILVNSAGYILEGAIEELSPQETLDTFNTNVFGALNVTRAILPYMRAQKSGVVTAFGSLGSWGGGPAYNAYCGTKWAISGIFEGLKPELAPLGITALVIEPGYFRTGLLNPGSARVSSAVAIKDYDDTAVGEVRKLLNQTDNNQKGDVKRGARVIVDVLTRTGVAEGRDVPVRLVLGPDCQTYIREKCESTVRLLDEWKEVSYSTDYPEGE